jgi:hydrogenase expression/formation protein HypC
MCLAVPMKLVELSDDAQRGVADLDGARTRVNLGLIEDPSLGDFVIVHAGFAIERLDEGEANERLAMFDTLGEQWREQEAERVATLGSPETTASVPVKTQEPR